MVLSYHMKIIYILLNNQEMYLKVKQKIQPEDFMDIDHKDIVKKIYEKYESSDMNIDINVNSILDYFSEEIQNKLTEIMTEDYGISDSDKALEDILIKYEREKLEKRRDEILEEIENEHDSDAKKKLGQELNSIILKLVRIK